jgi:hypothetical protein
MNAFLRHTVRLLPKKAALAAQHLLNSRLQSQFQACCVQRRFPAKGALERPSLRRRAEATLSTQVGPPARGGLSRVYPYLPALEKSKPYERPFGTFCAATDAGPFRVRAGILHAKIEKTKL